MPKTILVTGASSGFGRLICETLAGSGHTVFASMRDTAGKNRDHAKSLRNRGLNVVDLDVTQAESIEAAVSGILSTQGQIDVLVNNAGVASAGVSEAFSDQQVADLFNVNVVGVHRVTRAVLPSMRQQGKGLVVNIGSILGRVTFPFFGIYGASKFAVEALSDSYRYELSQLGIDVCLVQPSAFPTQMYASAAQPVDQKTVSEYGDTGKIPAEMFEQFMAMLSGPEAPAPQDVADAVSGLVSQSAGTRPARVVVGTSFGADEANAAMTPLQTNTINALGLSHLAAIKTG
ncbi:SDR family oxidoreductase [Pseudophaeobacter sp.]|jgi:NAD(P)-dependent dehydrogenase (short-subunit alcohol dehydrogenase family)|uniref:SDR family oxidoreductase n=1 Tax=Pseudophaeobacter sp. TaxID=1971739 RepID=UPI0025F24F04|nr:SDR family oxidoreductase [uncultured Pseudophaeobacter sp.]